MTVIIKTKFTNQISLTNYLNQINYSDTVMVTEVVILFYTSNHLGYKPLFSIRLFVLQTLTIHMTAAEGMEPSFIPLHHFHPLINIETLICNFISDYLLSEYLSRK